jgi:5-methylcytosine-specific restriction endonuclease McrA
MAMRIKYLSPFSLNAIIYFVMENPVLVLNANYEPINVCRFERAVGLMVTGKAFLILNGRGTINSASATFPIPSVIRLDHLILRPRPKVALSRLEVFRRDTWHCQYCSDQSRNLTVDHVLPKHLGGQHTWTNLVTACPACNHRKGGRTLRESGMTLQRIPKEPPSSASYVFSRYLNDNQEWVSFLAGW